MNACPHAHLSGPRAAQRREAVLETQARAAACPCSPHAAVSISCGRHYKGIGSTPNRE
jgi:hypothetical protein